MYRTLFDIAGVAIVAWLLLILLPRWRVPRWLAETAAFPVFLSLIYLFGIVSVISESGAGFMGDFGSAEGVLGLLATEPVAIIAWIHILAFDQVVGLLIYRDNMRHRFVPLPIQSVILFATLMLGPIGFLTYWVVRMSRSRSGRVAWGEREMAPAAGPAIPSAPAPEPAVRYADVVQGNGVVDNVVLLLRRNPSLVALAGVGFVLSGITIVIAAVNGGWLLGAEGRLQEAIRFDVALSIYTLTVALILPLAGFSEARRSRWVRWLVGLTLFSFGVETIQSWRGLDPRFSEVAGNLDRAMGGVFLFAALGIMVLLIVLFRRFFSDHAIPDHPMLRLALRYGFVGALLGFGIGLVMSVVVQGREVGLAGDFMPLHAAGFHALQAVPVVALLLGAGAAARHAALVHIAGAGWLALCLGLLLQAASGQPTLAPSPFSLLALSGAAAWAFAAARALWLRSHRTPVLA